MRRGGGVRARVLPEARRGGAGRGGAGWDNGRERRGGFEKGEEEGREHGMWRLLRSDEGGGASGAGVATGLEKEEETLCWEEEHDADTDTDTALRLS